MTNLLLTLLLAGQAQAGAIRLPGAWGRFDAPAVCTPVDLAPDIDAVIGEVKCPGVGLDMLVFAAAGSARGAGSLSPSTTCFAPERAAPTPISFVTLSGAEIRLCPGPAGSNMVKVLLATAVGRIEFHATTTRPEQHFTLLAIVASYRPAPDNGAK